MRRKDEFNMMTIQSLQEIVNEGVIITEHNGIVYADFVEDNGDEHRLTQSSDINNVAEYLKNHGLLSGN